MGRKYVVVITSCPTADEASAVANALIDRRLAACVQSSPIVSTYRWQGRVEQANETRLQIKTTTARFDEVSKLINETLSYENPEILSIPVVDGAAEYLEWIDRETDSDF